MNKKRSVLGIVVLVSLCVLTTLLMDQGMSTAAECQIVKISERPGTQYGVQIEPMALWIKKGDCVIWFNNRIRSSNPEIMIKFREGKKCDEMTEAPTGFSLDAIEDCYVTGMIPYAGTSSLRFVEKGTYEYEVIVSGKEPAKGKIEVGEQ